MTDDKDLHRLWRSGDAAFAPLPLAEIKRRAATLDDRIARRNRREYVAVGVVVAIFALYAVVLPEPLLRIGSLLAIAGALVVAWQLACRTSRADPVAESADVRAFYRARLVTEEHMLARVGRWYLAPLVPGLATFLAGTAVASGLANPIGFAAVAALPALLFAGVWLLNRRAAAMLRGRIARLDAASPFEGENG